MATLTRHRIIDAAIDVIDEHGLDALTMRALAERLDVTATALYYHFNGREELLEAIVTQSTSHLVTDLDTDGDWREQIRVLVLATVAELTRHPDLAVWIITTHARQPSVLELHEALLRILIGAGFTPPAAIRAKGILFRLVIGHLALAGAPDGPPWRQLPKRYTHLRSTGPAHDTIDLDQMFQDGVDTVLNGLDPGE